MEVLYILVPISLALVGGGIALFAWALKDGQMDDLERPGHSILYDDDEDMIPEEARRHRPGKPEADPEAYPGRSQSDPKRPQK